MIIYVNLSINSIMKIEATYFLVAMFLTIFVLYVFSPKPEVIVKYPDIKEEISNVYVDDKGVCYRYHRVEVNDDQNDKN